MTIYRILAALLLTLSLTVPASADVNAYDLAMYNACIQIPITPSRETFYNVTTTCIKNATFLMSRASDEIHDSNTTRTLGLYAANCTVFAAAGEEGLQRQALAHRLYMLAKNAYRGLIDNDKSDAVAEQARQGLGRVLKFDNNAGADDSK